MSAKSADNFVRIRIKVVHRGETYSARVKPGKDLATALQTIGYPRAGHKYWRLWHDGQRVDMGLKVTSNMEISMTHVNLVHF